MLHMRSTMTNPVLSARIKSGEIKVVGLFQDADGAFYMLYPEQNKYELIWSPSTHYKTNLSRSQAMKASALAHG
jgi:hypothetical protein